MKIHLPCLFTILFLLACSHLRAQDIIFFKDGRKDTVKVTEITAKTVSYKKMARLDGPTYIVKKAEIALIEYADGSIEVFEAAETEEKEEKKTKPPPIEYGRHIVSGNVFGLFLGNLHVGYERLSPSGMFGFRTNLIITMVPDITDVSLLFSGFDFNFYPGGQKRVSYFLGPSVRFGFVDPSNNGDFLELIDPFYAILFNNGVLYRPSKSFYMSTQLGVGMGVYQYNKRLPYGYLMLNLGWRF